VSPTSDDLSRSLWAKESTQPKKQRKTHCTTRAHRQAQKKRKKKKKKNGRFGISARRRLPKWRTRVSGRRKLSLANWCPSFGACPKVVVGQEVWEAKQPRKGRGLGSKGDICYVNLRNFLNEEELLSHLNRFSGSLTTASDFWPLLPRQG
jgi:hypothetical protein